MGIFFKEYLISKISDLSLKAYLPISSPPERTIPDNLILKSTLIGCFIELAFCSRESRE